MESQESRPNSGTTTALYKSIMLSAHTIILPFYSPVEVTEMSIISDVKAIVSEDKCHQFQLPPS